MVVFLLSGLWHGANWTFVIWGTLNGLCIALEMIAGKSSGGGRRWPRIFLTFNLISLGWIFFRAKSISDAFYILRHLIPDFIGPDLANLVQQLGASTAYQFNFITTAPGTSSAEHSSNNRPRF